MYLKAGYLVSLLAAIVSIIGVGLITYLFYNIFFSQVGMQLLVIVFAIGLSSNFLNSIARVVLRINNKFKVNSLINMLMYSIELCTIFISLYFFKADLFILIFVLTAVNIFNCLLCNVTALYEVRKEVQGFWKVSLSCLAADRVAITGFIINNSLSKTLQKESPKR